MIWLKYCLNRYSIFYLLFFFCFNFNTLLCPASIWKTPYHIFIKDILPYDIIPICCPHCVCLYSVPPSIKMWPVFAGKMQSISHWGKLQVYPVEILLFLLTVERCLSPLLCVCFIFSFFLCELVVRDAECHVCLVQSGSVMLSAF